ncbi:DUF6340 family protein [Pontibacter locisalis]|uniref:DUF6340 family protein n=1 Tax=Pontibacter locisalis TaxID=1719035 RepID=A0ABW5IR47_9BACT
MKKTIINLALFIVAGLSLMSCTSQLFIDTTLPPAVDVGNEQWKVVAIKRFNPALLPFKREKKTEVFQNGADEALAGVLEAIHQDHTYQIVAVDTSSAYLANSPNEQLTRDQVKSIHQKYPHHLLLTLDNIDASFHQMTTREKDSDETVVKTAHYTLITTTTWTLYDSLGTVLDRMSLRQEEPYQTRDVVSGLLAVGPSMGNAGPAVNRLAWRTGKSYWRRLSPQRVSLVRPYYSMKAFEPAAYQIAAGKWDQAIALLQPLAESKNRKDAGKAAYNLAVVHEAKGDIKGAQRWARQAADSGNKLAALLLPDLQNYGN